MCDAIILAAGLSSRVGINKLNLKINKQSILSMTIESLYETCNKIVVVGGHYFDEVLQITKKYKKVSLIKNTEYMNGMFSSVKCGVKEMENDFFLLPGDYPLIKESTYIELKDCIDDISVPVYKGIKGHPIFIRKHLKMNLLEEDTSSNLKIFRDKQSVTYIDVDDEGVITDIDSIEDYKAVVKKVRGG